MTTKFTTITSKNELFTARISRPRGETVTVYVNFNPFRNLYFISAINERNYAEVRRASFYDNNGIAGSITVRLKLKDGLSMLIDDLPGLLSINVGRFY